MSDEKYVFFDIDGTIYDYKRGIPDSTREAIRLLRENGHHPVVCTGRTRIMIFDSIIDLGFDGIVGGAGAYVSWKDKVIYEYEMSRSELIRVIECFRKNGFASYPEGNDTFYYDPLYVKDGEGETYRIYQKEIPEHLFPINYDDIRASKVSANYTERSNTQAVIDELGDDYFWVDHNGVLLELFPKNVSKGLGIEMLMNHLGETMENTYAFGDSFNDLDMLMKVRYGVVMGNGNDELKARFRLTTEGMMEDGVYNALKRFGLI